MFYQNDFITKNIKTQQMNAYLEQAEKDRLLAQLNSHQSTLLTTLMRGTLHAIGHLFLTIGQRMDRIGTAHPDVRIGNASSSK